MGRGKASWRAKDLTHPIEGQDIEVIFLAPAEKLIFFCDIACHFSVFVYIYPAVKRLSGAGACNGGCPWSGLTGVTPSG
jgi:hypothetical protein